jgi:hypothetical protein
VRRQGFWNQLRRNLIDDPAYDDVQAKLDARVLENMNATGDAWNLEIDIQPPNSMPHAEAHRYLLEEGTCVLLAQRSRN